MKNIAITFVLLFLLLLCSESATACQCRRAPVYTEKLFRKAIAEELRHSAVVFSGEAVERGSFGLRFRVDKVWKGKVTNEIVFSPMMDAGYSPDDGREVFVDSCALFIEVGKKYLVYAREAGGGDLFLSKCSRTQILERAERDINELGRLKPKGRVK